MGRKQATLKGLELCHSSSLTELLQALLKGSKEMACRIVVLQIKPNQTCCFHGGQQGELNMGNQ